MKRLGVFLPLLLLATVTTHAQVPPGHRYTRVNLVSDIAGVARFTDPNLVNPWGLVSSSTSPFWVSDNGSGLSTLYNAKGQAFPVGPSPLVVTIPAYFRSSHAALASFSSRIKSSNIDDIRYIEPHDREVLILPL